MNDSAAGKWQALCDAFERFSKNLRRSRSINVNSQALRTEGRTLVEQYFRRARPELISLGFGENDLDALDSPFQEILRLSNGMNAASSYKHQLRSIQKILPQITGRREFYLGASSSARLKSTEIERQIIATLTDLIPSAAMSYQQALFDLSSEQRVSFRGPAVELREALREVIDHLAPDQAVVKSQALRLET